MKSNINFLSTRETKLTVPLGGCDDGSVRENGEEKNGL